MNPIPVSELPEIVAASSLFFVLLVPFAGIGLVLITTGLSRSRNAAHTVLASLCLFATAALTFFVCGFAWQGFAGGPAYGFAGGGAGWNWIAAERFFLLGVRTDTPGPAVVALLQIFCVGLAALIPLCSGAERWRLGASCASTALLAGWTYPLFAHWVWGGGWLAGLGTQHGIGHGFLDAGGSSTIQVVGGLTALSLAWILGSRRGKYTNEGTPNAIPGHNAVLVLFGCLLAIVGWVGLNVSGAILFAGADGGGAAIAAINTVLCASAAGLAAAGVTKVRFGKPDASLCANGWVAGLVASSAGCAYVVPAVAVGIGLIAGILVPVCVEKIESRIRLDDPAGAVSVHVIGGIWGLLAVGFFAKFPVENFESAAPGTSGQWLAQLIGVATLLGFVLPMTYGLNWLLNHFYPQRVSTEGEQQGMDLHELGTGAYPEFDTGEEFRY